MQEPATLRARFDPTLSDGSHPNFHSERPLAFSATRKPESTSRIETSTLREHTASACYVPGFNDFKSSRTVAWVRPNWRAMARGFTPALNAARTRLALAAVTPSIVGLGRSPSAEIKFGLISLRRRAASFAIAARRHSKSCSFRIASEPARSSGRSAPCARMCPFATRLCGGASSPNRSARLSSGFRGMRHHTNPASTSQKGLLPLRFLTRIEGPRSVANGPACSLTGCQPSPNCTPDCRCSKDLSGTRDQRNGRGRLISNQFTRRNCPGSDDPVP